MAWNPNPSFVVPLWVATLMLLAPCHGVPWVKGAHQLRSTVSQYFIYCYLFEKQMRIYIYIYNGERERGERRREGKGREKREKEERLHPCLTLQMSLSPAVSRGGYQQETGSETEADSIPRTLIWGVSVLRDGLTPPASFQLRPLHLWFLQLLFSPFPVASGVLATPWLLAISGYDIFLSGLCPHHPLP